MATRYRTRKAAPRRRAATTGRRRRSGTARRAAPKAQTIKIVIEQPNPSPVVGPLGNAPMTAIQPRLSKF